MLRTIPSTPAPFLNLMLSSASPPSSFQQSCTAKEWGRSPFLWSQCKTSPSKSLLVCGVERQQALAVYTACDRGPGKILQHPPSPTPTLWLGCLCKIWNPLSSASCSDSTQICLGAPAGPCASSQKGPREPLTQASILGPLPYRGNPRVAFNVCGHSDAYQVCHSVT